MPLREHRNQEMDSALEQQRKRKSRREGTTETRKEMKDAKENNIEEGRGFETFNAHCEFCTLRKIQINNINTMDETEKGKRA